MYLFGVAKLYEASNHLGNVLVTISDKKLGKISNLVQTKAEYYEAIVKTASDYYPFGWQMPNRKLNAENYSFGFNGQVQDAEWMGGQSVAFEFRTQDTRLGRFLSTDPLTATTPWQTPYAFADNSPIWKIDYLGLFGDKKAARAYKREHKIRGRIRKNSDGQYEIVKRGGVGSITKDPEFGIVAGASSSPRTVQGRSILFAKRNPSVVNRLREEVSQSHLQESIAYKWAHGNTGQQIVYGVLNEFYTAPQAWVSPYVTTLEGTVTDHPDDRMAGLSIIPGMGAVGSTAKVTTRASSTALKVVKSQGVRTTVVKKAIAQAGCFVGGTVVLTVDSLVAIDSLEVGMLVAVSLEHAENPLFHDLLASTTLFEQLKELPIVPKEWRKLELELSKPNGDKTLIELLRPQSWIAENLQKDSTAVYVSLPEMGSVGYAKVLSIDTCVIQLPDSGSSYRPITGKFIHISNMVWELSFEGMSKPLGVTSNHPIWSYDRERWVDAGELEIGEFVATQGEPVRLLGKKYLEGEYRVYNIEVYDAHNYFVGREGVLVHNTCDDGWISKAIYSTLGKKDPKLRDVFESALAKGIVNAKGQAGIKRLAHPKTFGGKKYFYELKTPPKSKYGNHRLYGNIEDWVKPDKSVEKMIIFEVYKSSH